MALYISGDHNRDPVPGVNAFNVLEGDDSIHTMNFGLNISMLINFVAESTIYFSSAGASFIVPAFE